MTNESNTADTFDWIPFYEEFADKLVGYQTKQQELITFLENLRADGLKITPLEDKDETGRRFPLTEIDPFTFFGSFNRGIVKETRIGILQAAKAKFNLAAPAPTDFAGIPTLNNQRSWFFAYQADRKPGDIDRLWVVFTRALGQSPLVDPEFEQAFDDALTVRYTNVNLTMGLFWIRPNTFLSLDSSMREHLSIKLPSQGLSFQYYRAILEQVRKSAKQDLPHLSHAAWLKPKPPPPPPKTDTDYWLVGAYWDSEDPRTRRRDFWPRESGKTGTRIAISIS